MFLVVTILSYVRIKQNVFELLYVSGGCNWSPVSKKNPDHPDILSLRCASNTATSQYIFGLHYTWLASQKELVWTVLSFMITMSLT